MPSQGGFGRFRGMKWLSTPEAFEASFALGVLALVCYVAWGLLGPTT